MTVRTRTRLAALLASSVVVLAGCGTGDDPEADDPNDTSGTGTTSEKPTKQPSPEAETSDAAGGTPEQVAVPVYFVGDTPRGPRLYREFRNVEADNPVDEALALLAAGDALDADYSTLLPGQVQLTGSDANIVVSVPASWTERASGMSAAEARLAVQQVVFTVQGALQQRHVVQFTVDGAATPVLGLDKSDFEAQEAVLAQVNVTQPAEGSTVADTFTASGVANSFEANVPWEVRDENDKTVLNGFATAEGWMDKLYPWEAPIDVSTLAPGTYTFVAMTDDPSDGESAGPTEDTKTITVE
jgi:immunoglobulin-like protein involved in spore germination/sporulation and spore germination protein